LEAPITGDSDLQLRERGHSDARVAKILGGNFARLFREVWT
jgi:membrane dipeptidase